MNSPSYSEQIHLALAHGPHRVPARPAAAGRHRAAVAEQPDGHHAGAQRADADADVGVHHHLEPLLPPPVPVPDARRHGLVDDHPLRRRHERHGGDGPRRVVEPVERRPPQRDVPVGVGQRDAPLAAAVPERDPLVGVPRHGADAHCGVQGRDAPRRRRGGGVAEAEPDGRERLEVERRRARAVVEVGEAGRGEGEAEREEGETRGEAAQPAARARAAPAVVALLPVPRLPRAAWGRRLVLARRRRLEREHLRRRRERWFLERRRGGGSGSGPGAVGGADRRRRGPCRRGWRLGRRPRIGRRQGRLGLGRQRRLLGHGGGGGG